MSVKLKKLKDQVIVITGASSGIGLATAKMAASYGAKVVLASRNLPELQKICDEINSSGGRSICVEADVADVKAVQRVADRAIQEFGGFDTWVNNAGVSIYGKLTEVPMDEKKRLFDVNFWGVVNGCRAAVRHLRERGGAIINLGSVLSERSMPIQGIYSASKHAVKAYTDALRMELEADRLPISVTLVKPAAIDTPYTEHAVNHMANKPVHQPPVYAPEVVAKAILECAETPKRDIYIGGSAKFYSLLETFVPRLTDFYMELASMEKGQSTTDIPRDAQKPALFDVPDREGAVHGAYPGRVMNSSAYTSAALHPGAATLIAAGLGVAAAAGINYFQSRRSNLSETPAH